ncbi:thiosulfate sulfurtransferase/rhodanese-like domain-containing protein 3 isoform X3 [Penaeus indicus]|uniref:thiosulfate sulfurtransferase/rhodanese-like domain-containing protein 3 isoform X3 n=1 Tax=Penaeus indicus TaxID=29960 RepID=UPI00300CB0AF
MEVLAKSLAAAPRLLMLSCSTCAQQIAHASSSRHVCSPAHEVAPALSNGNGNGMGGGNGRRLNRRTELDFEELMALQMAGDIALIDVRNPQELEKHDAIPGAVNIPLCHLKLALQLSDEEWAREFQVEKPTKCDRNLVFYARGPNASSAAVEIAHRLGFKMSRHYIGGWEEYSKKTGQPLTKSQDAGPFSNYYQNQFDQYFL